MQDSGAGLKRQRAEPPTKPDALALKEAGNAAFKCGDLAQADLQYSAALGASPAAALQLVLLSNRAEVTPSAVKPFSVSHETAMRVSIQNP